ncbi:MAG: hypothetical protein DME34_04680 [Verrucomicrobia bacterium]|nr:MAG: hypothetical protein DME34_04680 [Verrucomicrobiota bacterium]
MIAWVSTEERLATLRSLLERRAVYQRRFARAGLIGGILSMATAAALFINDEVTPLLDRPIGPRQFASAWLIVLAITLASGASLSLRSARPGGNPSGVTRLKFVLSGIAPYLLIPAAFTAWFFGTGYLGGTELDLVVVWIAAYGLVLVSTVAFAPRSIVLLGWACLLTAVGVPLLEEKLDLWIGDMPSLLMGLTFGLYHCIYAVFNWRGNTQ